MLIDPDQPTMTEAAVAMAVAVAVVAVTVAVTVAVMAVVVTAIVEFGSEGCHVGENVHAAVLWRRVA